MEIKIEYDDFVEKVAESYEEGFVCGKAHGVSDVMKWLESGKELKEWLIDSGHCGPNVKWENLKDWNWFRIERIIIARTKLHSEKGD